MTRCPACGYRFGHELGCPYYRALAADDTAWERVVWFGCIALAWESVILYIVRGGV